MKVRQALALFRVYWADIFAYRAVAFIWMFSDLQDSILLPLVWHAAGGMPGYSVSEIGIYYVLALSISQIVTCHLLWDIGFEIREGLFSEQLMRPVSHLASSFVRNLAWRWGKFVLFLPVLMLMLAVYGIPSNYSLRLIPEFWISLALGQVMAFFIAYALSMIALWTTDFMSLFQIYYFPEMLLSGRVVPIESLPDGVQKFSSFAHFRYTVGFPTEIAMNRISQVAIWQGLGIQIAWIAIFWGLSAWLFRKGCQQYSGFGM